MSMYKNFFQKRGELLLVILLLVISGVSHGYNMFHFPYYENDEGTYMSQAWSLVTEGKLAPYTYWYDHAPAGWMLIALWTKLTGGFFTFGMSVNSGRVLMLVLHLISSALLYYIAKRLSGTKLAGIIAVLIFSLSPLGIYFQRRVLLDNIMIFWVLGSLAILLKEKLKLRHIIVSAMMFGVAVLTKENAIFFIPAFLYAIYSHSNPAYRSFAIVKWLIISGSIISLYFLYALLKGEFFPVGMFGGNDPHVSLLGTLQEQLNRGSGLPFWDLKSDFYITLQTWLSRDYFTIVTGAIATLLGAVLSIKIKSLRISAFFALLFWVFLLRGKLVIDFYVAPLIPLLGLNIGVLLSVFLQWVSKSNIIYYSVFSAIFIIIIPVVLLSNTIGQYTKDETTPQIEVVNWIKKNLPADSNLVVDYYAFIDLRDARSENDKVFQNAHWFWKVQADPEIRDGIYKNDWKNIEYIILSHEMLKQIEEGNMEFIRTALDQSVLVMEWRENSTSYFDFEKYISTNGDWARVLKVQETYRATLDTAWRNYRQEYIQSYGQVVDPQQNNRTTSEGQSYAMLRAVWQDDRETFDGVWQWTQDHLQHRSQDKLISWLWVKDGDTYKLGDSAPASDADEDIALALLFAYKRWDYEAYLSYAKDIINDIWEHEVMEINDRYYLMAGVDMRRGKGYLVNPSYVSPATYRIFAEVDTAHPWLTLADNSYTLLADVTAMEGNRVGLPSNWIFVDAESGAVQSASDYIQSESDMYGYDAFRTMWRVALDWQWFKEPQAYDYLKGTSVFFADEWRVNKSVATAYSLDSKRKASGDISTNVGALSAFIFTDPPMAKEFYENVFENSFSFESGYWDDPNNYYTQNWAWFGTALYSGNLPNL